MFAKMCRNVLIVAALSLVAFFANDVALAAAPGNDDIANAVTVTRLPFSHTVDITEATHAPDDLHCGTLPGGNTVWYKITPRSDTRIGFHVETAVPELSMSIFDGWPGSSVMLYCSYSSYNALEATGGTTYYIQLATCCGAEGGPVTITMQEVQPLAVDLRTEHRAYKNGSGLIEVEGQVRCNRQTPPGSEVVVQGTLIQGAAQGWLVPVHLSGGCSERWMAWSTTVQVLTSEGFRSGKAALRTTAFACDEFDACAAPATKTLDVRLR
ncbi:MAG TPA: hypothetical protein VGR43_06230 [Dehalococcoidia bacterium]|nr:hypothetical protein [Dehalococcoidia bacterium]